MPRRYIVQFIDFKKRNKTTSNVSLTIDRFASESPKAAAIEAQSLASIYRRQGYNVVQDKKYADVPDGYRPYLIYDYFGRSQGRPPGRNPNYKLVYKIVVVDDLNRPVDKLFAEGVLRLK